MSKASEFFKSMFRRATGSPKEERAVCRECQVEMSTESLGNRVLERCPKCQGTWLSRAQLMEIVEQAQAGKLSQEAAVVSDGEAQIGHTFAPSRVARSCPVCQGTMSNFKYEETGIWIDACSEHGVWLDAGELKLIAQRSQGKTPGQASSEVMEAVTGLIIGSL